MQSVKNLKARLNALVDAIESEASRNPSFAAELCAVFGNASAQDVTRIHRPAGTNRKVTVPDVFATIQEKGEEEFKFWLRTLDLPTLKAIVKHNGFDPARVSQRWKDADKFSALIQEQTQARLRRGAAFLPPKATGPASSE